MDGIVFAIKKQIKWTTGEKNKYVSTNWFHAVNTNLQFTLLLNRVFNIFYSLYQDGYSEHNIIQIFGFTVMEHVV